MTPIPIASARWKRDVAVMVLAAVTLPSPARAHEIAFPVSMSCPDDGAIRGRVEANIEDAGKQWPPGLSYELRLTDDGRIEAIVVQDGDESGPLGPFDGRCEDIESALVAALTSATLSKAPPATPEPTLAWPESTARPGQSDSASRPDEGKSAQATPAPALTRKASPRPRKTRVRPSLVIGAGYATVPGYTGQADAHALELRPGIELVRPGWFAVALRFRRFVPVSYASTGRGTFAELSVCQRQSWRDFDAGICGSAGPGVVHMPASSSGTGYATESRPWLFGAAAQFTWWASDTTPLQITAGTSAVNQVAVRDGWSFSPHVLIGAAWVFGASAD